MRSKEKWSRWHKYGKKKFVFFYAVFWSLSVSLVSIFMKGLFNHFHFGYSTLEIYTDFLIRSLFNFIFGMIMGLFVWNNNEKNMKNR